MDVYPLDSTMLDRILSVVGGGIGLKVIEWLLRRKDREQVIAHQLREALFEQVQYLQKQVDATNRRIAEDGVRYVQLDDKYRASIHERDTLTRSVEELQEEIARLGTLHGEAAATFADMKKRYAELVEENLVLRRRMDEKL